MTLNQLLHFEASYYLRSSMLRRRTMDLLPSWAKGGGQGIINKTQEPEIVSVTMCVRLKIQLCTTDVLRDPGKLLIARRLPSCSPCATVAQINARLLFSNTTFKRETSARGAKKKAMTSERHSLNKSIHLHNPPQITLQQLRTRQRPIRQVAL